RDAHTDLAVDAVQSDLLAADHKDIVALQDDGGEARGARLRSGDRPIDVDARVKVGGQRFEAAGELVESVVESGVADVAAEPGAEVEARGRHLPEAESVVALAHFALEQLAA